MFLNMFFFLFFLSFSYDEPKEIVVYKGGDYGSKYYRIPGIVVAHDNSLVVSTDKRWKSPADLPNVIDLLGRRSTDFGRTWSEPALLGGGGADDGYGDGSLVVDRKSGVIICTFCGEGDFFNSTFDKPHHIFYVKSYDNGATWTEKVDITSQLYGINCSHLERKYWNSMFITSGSSLQLRSGRIMAVAVVRKGHEKDGYSDYVVYTDDLGKTWDVGLMPACDLGDESKMVELNNGDILMTIRHKLFRYFAISHDKGLTWDPYYEMRDIVDPGCNGEIKRYTSTKDGYDKDRILHTNLHHPTDRKNLTVRLSYDEGKTWPVQKVLHSELAMYSSIAILPNGTIAVYYEKTLGPKDVDGFEMRLALFSLEWLTDGKDSYKPPK
ncbi:secreted sialidase [Tritrichomonas foetus]|uniref:Secreted sialidase n=1 Tax=Tritrichomonas foetus TaxID=1144522 RepID=A0A1J4JMP0_9EUKA|nr:secreted sialidase [Tritrichomonas foetus]|eukprot:OHT00383.1 secreted sialidase [Tritrichomonas foetus]